jgi:tetratricopeptide (TPR) repeat protein
VESLGDVHGLRGLCYLATENYDDAVGDFRQSVELYEVLLTGELLKSARNGVRQKLSTAKMRLGMAYLDKGNFSEAITTLNKIEKDRRTFTTCTILGDAYLMAKENKKAEDNYKQALCLVNKIPLNSRGEQEYRESIIAEARLKALNLDVTTNYVREAIDRAIFTEKEITEVIARRTWNKEK